MNDYNEINQYEAGEIVTDKDGTAYQAVVENKKSTAQGYNNELSDRGVWRVVDFSYDFN